MKQKTGIGFIFCLLAIMSILSCCRRSDEPAAELVDGTVRICFEWDTVPSGIQPPEGMTLRFYPESGEGTVYEMKSDTVSFSRHIGGYRLSRTQIDCFGHIQEATRYRFHLPRIGHFYTKRDAPHNWLGMNP